MRSKLIGIAPFGLAAIAVPAAAFQAAQPAPPAAALAAQPSEALRMRADQMVDLFNGKRPLLEFFVPGIPVERFNSNLAAIRNEFGAGVRVSALEATTPNSGIVTVDFERGQRRMRLRVTDAPPHLVNDFGPAG